MFGCIQEYVVNGWVLFSIFPTSCQWLGGGQLSYKSYHRSSPLHETAGPGSSITGRWSLNYHALHSAGSGSADPFLPLTGWLGSGLPPSLGILYKRPPIIIN